MGKVLALHVQLYTFSTQLAIPGSIEHRPSRVPEVHLPLCNGLTITIQWQPLCSPSSSSGMAVQMARRRPKHCCNCSDAGYYQQHGHWQYFLAATRMERLSRWHCSVAG